MKKKVKGYVDQIEAGAQNRHNVLRDFSKMLDTQVTSLNRSSLWKIDLNKRCLHALVTIFISK